MTRAINKACYAIIASMIFGGCTITNEKPKTSLSLAGTIWQYQYSYVDQKQEDPYPKSDSSNQDPRFFNPGRFVAFGCKHYYWGDGCNVGTSNEGVTNTKGYSTNGSSITLWSIGEATAKSCSELGEPSHQLFTQALQGSTSYVYKKSELRLHTPNKGVLVFKKVNHVNHFLYQAAWEQDSQECHSSQKP